MRIFIITMEDPLYTVPFIKEIVTKRKKDIIGIAISKGDRLTIGRDKSKSGYILSLFLIMGPLSFIKNVYATITFKFKKKLSKKLSFIKDPGLASFAEEMEIPSYNAVNPNDDSFLDLLRKNDIDVIINQSQSILQKELLDIPKIGVVNRHNALLPKNRGRLTPFWVLYKGEKETGVSIHFVTEGIDDGPIIVQEKYLVQRSDNFNTLVKKNYELAPKAMLRALEKLEQGDYDYIENDNALATYNTVPTVSDALQYRIRQIASFFKMG